MAYSRFYGYRGNRFSGRRFKKTYGGRKKRFYRRRYKGKSRMSYSKKPKRVVEFDLVDLGNQPNTIFFTTPPESVHSVSTRIFNVSLLIPTCLSLEPLDATSIYVSGIKLCAVFSRVVSPSSGLAARSMAYRLVLVGSNAFGICGQKNLVNLCVCAFLGMS